MGHLANRVKEAKAMEVRLAKHTQQLVQELVAKRKQAGKIKTKADERRLKSDLNTGANRSVAAIFGIEKAISSGASVSQAIRAGKLEKKRAVAVKFVKRKKKPK